MTTRRQRSKQPTEATPRVGFARWGVLVHPKRPGRRFVHWFWDIEVASLYRDQAREIHHSAELIERTAAEADETASEWLKEFLAWAAKECPVADQPTAKAP